MDLSVTFFTLVVIGKMEFKTLLIFTLSLSEEASLFLYRTRSFLALIPPEEENLLWVGRYRRDGEIPPRATFITGESTTGFSPFDY